MLIPAARLDNAGSAAPTSNRSIDRMGGHFDVTCGTHPAELSTMSRGVHLQEGNCALSARDQPTAACVPDSGTRHRALHSLMRHYWFTAAASQDGRAEPNLVIRLERNTLQRHPVEGQAPLAVG